MVVWIDESSISVKKKWTKSWNLTGKYHYRKIDQSLPRYSLILATNIKGFVAAQVFQGTISRDQYRTFFDLLSTSLSKTQYVHFVDGASYH